MMGTIPRDTRKDRSLPPTLLTPPILQSNPAREKPLPKKRLSYFDIIAEPSNRAPLHAAKPPTPLENSQRVMEGLGINFHEGEHERRGIESKVVDESLAASRPASSGGHPQAQPQSNYAAQLAFQSPNFNHNPPELHDQTPSELIEELLEENYRGQAEIFVRNSSQASIRSLSLSQNSRFVFRPRRSNCLNSWNAGLKQC